MRVLLVEDDRLIRFVIASFLRVKGLSVSEADSGEEALELLQEERFDAIVLDIDLPGISGFEVAQHVRTNEPRDFNQSHDPEHSQHCTRLIALTGSIDAGDPAATRWLNIFDQVLHKPQAPEQVLTAIRAAR